MQNNTMRTDTAATKYSFEDMLRERGYIVYTNVGRSMLPLLREHRDIIEIRPLSGHPRKYDVVFYKRGEKYILHRVICVRRDGEYVIAGDNNTFKEYDVTEGMILGIMTRVIRNGRSITVGNWGYRLYSHLWVDFFPIRVSLLRIKAVFYRMIRKIFRILHAMT